MIGRAREARGRPQNKWPNIEKPTTEYPESRKTTRTSLTQLPKKLADTAIRSANSNRLTTAAKAIPSTAVAIVWRIIAVALAIAGLV